MKSYYDIIKRPIITEKSSGLVDKLQYTFELNAQRIASLTTFLLILIA